MDQSPPILVLIGPTASGKTRLAIELAEALPGGGECIGADSMQVYKGMDIGTASPTCLLYPSPSPRDKRQSRMPSSA